LDDGALSRKSSLAWTSECKPRQFGLARLG